MLTRLKSPMKSEKKLGAKSPAHDYCRPQLAPAIPWSVQPIRHLCLTLQEYAFPHPSHMADRY